jgi:hypothetical protein
MQFLPQWPSAADLRFAAPGNAWLTFIFAGSASAQDEMNAEGVVTFHTIIFLRCQSFFARLRNQEMN